LICFRRCHFADADAIFAVYYSLFASASAAVFAIFAPYASFPLMTLLIFYADAAADFRRYFLRQFTPIFAVSRPNAFRACIAYAILLFISSSFRHFFRHYFIADAAIFLSAAFHIFAPAGFIALRHAISSHFSTLRFDTPSLFYAALMRCQRLCHYAAAATLY